MRNVISFRGAMSHRNFCPPLKFCFVSENTHCRWRLTAFQTNPIPTSVRGPLDWNHSRMEWLEKGKEMRYPFGVGSDLELLRREIYLLATTSLKFTNNSCRKTLIHQFLWNLANISSFLHFIYDVDAYTECLSLSAFTWNLFQLNKDSIPR